MSRQPLVFGKVDLGISPSDLIKSHNESQFTIFYKIIDDRNKIIENTLNELNIDPSDPNIRWEYHNDYDEISRYYYKDVLFLEFLGLEKTETDVCIKLNLKYKIYPLELDNV